MCKTIAAMSALMLATAGIVASEAPVSAIEACTVKLSSYTAPGSSDSLPGVHNAMQAIAAKGGGTLCVDGMYTVKGSINLDSIPRSADIRFVGTSTSSTGFTSAANAPLFVQNDQTLRPEAKGNTSSPMRGQYRYNTVFATMKLVKPETTTGRVFDFQTGAQVNARFENLQINNNAKGINSESFYFGVAHQAHGNLYQNLRVEQPGFLTTNGVKRTVNESGIIKAVGTGNFYNSNRWVSSTLYNMNGTFAPCIELRPANAQFANNVIQSVTGQNCAGGFIHAYGQRGITIGGSPNWDNVAGSVYRDTIRLGKTPTSGSVNGATLTGLGNVEESLGAKALMSGRHLIAVGAGVTGLTVTGTNATPKNTGLTY